MFFITDSTFPGNWRAPGEAGATSTSSTSFWSFTTPTKKKIKNHLHTPEKMIAAYAETLC